LVEKILGRDSSLLKIEFLSNFWAFPWSKLDFGDFGLFLNCISPTCFYSTLYRAEVAETVT